MSNAVYRASHPGDHIMCRCHHNGHLCQPCKWHLSHYGKILATSWQNFAISCLYWNSARFLLRFFQDFRYPENSYCHGKQNSKFCRNSERSRKSGSFIFQLFHRVCMELCFRMGKTGSCAIIMYLLQLFRVKLLWEANYIFAIIVE